MNAQRDFLLLMTLSVMAAAPAVGQTAAPSIPDFSGSWNHASLNGLELPISGPGPVRNRSRRLTGPQAGTGNGAQLVGDYTNPILQPWAAEVVKKFGEISLAGKGYPTPRNQCWPEQVPFVFANYGMQVIQQPDKVTILYPFDHQFRQVRLNEPHPAHGHHAREILRLDDNGRHCHSGCQRRRFSIYSKGVGSGFRSFRHDAGRSSGAENPLGRTRPPGHLD
jgi:hypothetical protein